MEVKISQEKINAAYAVADENIKKVLDALFGEREIKDKRPVTERIKTFDDAVSELGDNVLVQAYYNNALFDTDTANRSVVGDVLAYLKLRIIVAALNEGWTPQFGENEKRWYPWYWFYTNKEIDEMKNIKKDIYPVVSCSDSNAIPKGGISFSVATYDSMGSTTAFCTRLALKSKELAEYAGKQFIDIYAQMMGLEILMK